jgi:transcriptional regulator with XRE-family HTH domain
VYNKRYMDFLLAEMKNGKHPYVKDALNYLNQAAEKIDDEWLLKMAKTHLNYAIQELAKSDKVTKTKKGEEVEVVEPRDETGWRREFLINYYLNLELAHYKNLDESYTKWTVFREVVKENGWDNILSFMDRIDEYISSHNETENVRTVITPEEMQKIQKQYEDEILPFIRKNLHPVEQYQAKLRISQRLNLLQKKVPIGQKLSFGDWLKEKRTASGLSLNQLAERTGYSAAYIYRIEKGTRKNPTPKVVTKIIQALGYDPELIIPMFFADDQGGGDMEEGSMELLDWLKFANYTLAGEPVPEEKKKLLAEIVQLITEKDVLRGKKATELKLKIREFQK